ncbi:rhodanese-like domain-containing protein [Thermomonospora umbrina]|uniref:Rhodanese-related sulfurtransferase n=1 Tax=Thermomonospora umbrina TaxID=111806 RepID=A0A3D9SZB8_9ACTN|nr:rhodanese-like domain-containing protein [Thermomonospora umbrina]REF00928.1 rhodanese-related sulfurtransferase [Thermomonospora umbrina]
MVHNIDRARVRELADARDARIVEVLPLDEYARAHLPGAAHLPLAELAHDLPPWLDPARPIVVYCANSECDLSPRAAHRLEHLGARDVHDYTAGKRDWLSADLPYDGDAVLVSLRTRRDPVVAALDDAVDEVADRVLGDAAGLAVVVDDGGVVQGVVGGRELTGSSTGDRAGDVMNTGVTTVRPGEEVDPLVERMRRAAIDDMVVTRPDGTLVGLFSLALVRDPRSGPRP